MDQFYSNTIHLIPSNNVQDQQKQRHQITTQDYIMERLRRKRSHNFDFFERVDMYQYDIKTHPVTNALYAYAQGQKLEFDDPMSEPDDTDYQQLENELLQPDPPTQQIQESGNNSVQNEVVQRSLNLQLADDFPQTNFQQPPEAEPHVVHIVKYTKNKRKNYGSRERIDSPAFVQEGLKIAKLTLVYRSASSKFSKKVTILGRGDDSIPGSRSNTPETREIAGNSRATTPELRTKSHSGLIKGADTTNKAESISSYSKIQTYDEHESSKSTLAKAEELLNQRHSIFNTTESLLTNKPIMLLACERPKTGVSQHRYQPSTRPYTGSSANTSFKSHMNTSFDVEAREKEPKKFKSEIREKLRLPLNLNLGATSEDFNCSKLYHPNMMMFVPKEPTKKKPLIPRAQTAFARRTIGNSEKQQEPRQITFQDEEMIQQDIANDNKDSSPQEDPQHSSKVPVKKAKVIESRVYQPRKVCQRARNLAGSSPKRSEKKDSRPTSQPGSTGINSSDANNQSHSKLSSRIREGQSALSILNEKMTVELEQKSKRLSTPIRLKMRPSTPQSRTNYFEETKQLSTDQDTHNKPFKPVKRLDADSAMKIDVNSWRIDHEKTSQLIRNGILNPKGRRTPTDSGIREYNTRKSESDAKRTPKNKELNYTTEISPSNASKLNLSNLSNRDYIDSRSKDSIYYGTMNSSFSINRRPDSRGNSFGKAPRPVLFETKHNVSPGPKYEMTYHKGISRGHQAPKINLRSYDRSEYIVLKTASPSPQHYYQNREFEKSNIKGASPIFGYERNSRKKQAWEERLKQLHLQKLRDNPKIPFYRIEDSSLANPHRSFSKDQARELFRVDRDIPGPGNYDPRLSRNTTVAFGKAKRKTEPVNFG